jgi:hypothetical protein
MMSLNVEILSIELQRSYLSIQKREIFVHYTLFKNSSNVFPTIIFECIFVIREKFL